VKQIVDEREVSRAGRSLLQGNKRMPDTMAKAKKLLDELSGESPVHFRPANQLKELTITERLVFSSK